jgi:Flp pilus assembly protein TadG
MVEFAMILPLLVLLTFGIIEFGVAFNASSSVSQSTRAGGRTAAIFSTDPQLEFNAALAAATALDVSPNSITGQPTICVSKYVAGSDPCTNTYSYQVQPTHPGSAGAPVWTINWGQGNGVLPSGNDNWPIANRNFGCPTASQPNGVYDRVIVRVKIKHDLLVPGLFSQFFGNKTSPTITSDSVFQLEPVPTSTCP